MRPKIGATCYSRIRNSTLAHIERVFYFTFNSWCSLLRDSYSPSSCGHKHDYYYYMLCVTKMVPAQMQGVCRLHIVTYILQHLVLSLALGVLFAPLPAGRLQRLLQLSRVAL